MPEFEQTRLWIGSLGASDDDDYSHPRQRLRAALLDLRTQAELAGQTIAQVLSDLTLHDVTHADALWSTADEIVGENVSLNPVEAFVLGAAFYTHDLALGLAAFPDGLDELKPRVDEALAARQFQSFGRWPTDEELAGADEDERRAALFDVLRRLHAERAEDLLKSPIPHPDGEGSLYLLDDQDLRGRYAGMIGMIAHSHGWPVDRLGREFAEARGGPGWAPHWGVDRLLLACLLRLADAANVDERRAPVLLQAIHPGIAGDSRDHWTFQRRLQPARLNGDRLEFSAADSFRPSEAPAWWLCYETLRTVDRELHQVDALLSDMKRTRLAARSVAGIDSPLRFTAYVGVSGWEPVDAKIHVADIASLVRQLGGEELYGADLSVPLRELIQNGADAIRARRICDERDASYGTITVRAGRDDAENGEEAGWIEVEDNGLGMSLEVLQRFLLSFGTSYWTSPAASYDFPALTRERFSPTGRYGIGFFSVFMWGERVRVTSRRFDEGQSSTCVLEFESGVGRRPIIREANAGERLRDGGTRVRVWLQTEKVAAKDGANDDESGGLPGIEELQGTCRRLAPALDVNVDVEADGEERGAVVGGDWLTISPGDLYSRISEPLEQPASTRLAPDLIETSDGEIVGRGAIPLDALKSVGVAVIGGLRATAISHFDGVLSARPTRAARDTAMPLASLADMARWANLQAEQAAMSGLPPESLLEVAEVVRALGGSVRGLPLARTRAGVLEYSSLVELIRTHDTIRLVQDALLSMMEREEHDDTILLADNVLVVAMTIPTLIYDSHGGTYVSWPQTLIESSLDQAHDLEYQTATLEGAVVEAAAEAWNVSEGELVVGGLPPFMQPVATRGSKPLSARSTVVMQPGSREAIAHQRVEAARSIIQRDGAATSALLSQEVGVSTRALARLLEPYVEGGWLVKVKGGYEQP